MVKVTELDDYRGVWYLCQTRCPCGDRDRLAVVHEDAPVKSLECEACLGTTRVVVRVLLPNPQSVPTLLSFVRWCTGGETQPDLARLFP